MKGYVLVSISILGPGDKIKSPPKLSNADEIDMESNVLQPAGVQLQPCTYTIRVYKAEDLPESKSHFICNISPYYMLNILYNVFHLRRSFDDIRSCVQQFINFSG